MCVCVCVLSLTPLLYEYRLKKLGARVAILDADVYGPSLPHLISPKDVAIRLSAINPSWVVPLEYHGVRCMSFGFVNAKAAPGAGGKGAAVMRGAMVSKVIDQVPPHTKKQIVDPCVRMDLFHAAHRT
jgi:ATP-binding protein involved in chromosome partitioning